MKILTGTLIAFFLYSYSIAFESEIKGSVFFVTNGSVINKIPLAKVFVLNQKEANAMFAANSSMVKAKIAQAAKEQTDLINQKISDFNLRVNSHESEINKLRETIDELDKEIALQSKLVEQARLKATGRKGDKTSDENFRIYGGLTKSLSHLKNSRDKTSTDLSSAIESLNEANKSIPDIKHKLKYSSSDALLDMCNVPLANKPATKTDADGNFTIKMARDAVYIIIAPMDGSPHTAFLRWFLKINLLEKTNEKYLFTNDNFLFQENPARAINLILNDDVFKCELN